MSDILKKDTDIIFPLFEVLKASAGSGKTYTLTERYVQFLLSYRVPKNRLRNLLAITFSNNAAKEMKERVLRWLKEACLQKPEISSELGRVVSLQPEKISEMSGHLIDEIISNYSDFQIKTIDSFMTTVFKSSAIDFGYNPDFEILLNNNSVMEYAFDFFLKNVRKGGRDAAFLDEIMDILLGNRKEGSSYLWDPAGVLLNEVRNIYAKVAAIGKDPLISDNAPEMKLMADKIRSLFEKTEQLIVSSGLERRANSSYGEMLDAVRQGRFGALIGKSLVAPPINKPRKKQASADKAYEEITERWLEIAGCSREYTALYVRSSCLPYLMIYAPIVAIVEEAKKRQGKVFIEDINRYLAEYLDKEVVPDIYFRIGDTIFHFLIDEFQDTSPIQWRNLFPLIENSLSQDGSCFVVGDTKQAIYGFRSADYRIMKDCEVSSPFPSATHRVHELEINFRSRQAVLAFSEKVFKEKVREHVELASAAEKSGLHEYVQKAKADDQWSGFAGTVIFDRDDNDPHEKKKINELIAQLKDRGYNYGDISVLTQRNNDAVRVTEWLNEMQIPFVSFSSLDIRRRRSTGEIIALLNFLDSPTDDLSFATFVLGEIFIRSLSETHTGVGHQELLEFIFSSKGKGPLYKSFQRRFGSIWEEYFSLLFRHSGYLPLYDLITEVFAVFRIFSCLKEEEAALVKILDSIKDFEGTGSNSLRDYLFKAEDDSVDSGWEMNVPKGIDAVSVMTIHKAKGLGFPVSILLLYQEADKGFDFIVDEEGESAGLMRITKETAGADPHFQKLYDEERTKDRINRLNALYVGLTRAEEELYVIGVKNKKIGFPVVLLPTDEFPITSAPNFRVSGRKKPSRQFQIEGHPQGMVPPCRGDYILSIEDRKRGECIHRVLLQFEGDLEDLDQRIDKIIDNTNSKWGYEYHADEIRQSVKNVLLMSEVSEYFSKKAGRTVLKEQEFTDENGQLYRMDRVIVDADRVMVMDYKTGIGSGLKERHERQLRRYIEVLGSIYKGRKIEGMLVYADLGVIRRLT